MFDPQIYTISLAPSASASWSSFLSYARGPRCTADYLAFSVTAASTPWLSGNVATFTASNGHVSETIDYTTVLANYREAHCCGSCWLIYWSVDTYYWPNQPGSCFNSTNNNTGTVASHITQPPMLALGPNGITLSAPRYGSLSLIVGFADAFCSTSPSIHVRFTSFRASDRCGRVGPEVSEVILPFAPGELSTVRYPSKYTGQSGIEYKEVITEPFQMPCVTSGVSFSEPIFAGPTKLLKLYPEWNGCQIDPFYNGFDPPYFLTPFAAPAHTSAPEPVPYSTPATHGPSIAALPTPTDLAKSSRTRGPAFTPILIQTTNQHIPTAKTAEGSHQTAVSSTSSDPLAIDNIYVASEGLPTKTATYPRPPPAASPPPTPLATIAGHLLTAAPAPGIYAIDETTLTPGGPALTISNTLVSLDPLSNLIISSQAVHLPPYPTPVNPTAPSQILAVSIDASHSLTFTIASSAILIAGHTLHPGDPGLTIDGEILSLGSSELVLGTRTETFAPATTDGGGDVPIASFVTMGLGQVAGSGSGDGGLFTGSWEPGKTGVGYGTVFRGGAGRRDRSVWWVGAVGLGMRLGGVWV